MLTGAYCGERWNAEQDSHRDIQEIRTFSIGLAIQLGTTVYSVYTDSNKTKVICANSKFELRNVTVGEVV